MEGSTGGACATGWRRAASGGRRGRCLPPVAGLPCALCRPPPPARTHTKPPQHQHCFLLCRWQQGELDELEREEFFRLKKVQANKKKHAEAALAQAARGGGAEGSDAPALEAVELQGGGDVLQTQDEDVIF